MSLQRYPTRKLHRASHIKYTENSDSDVSACHSDISLESIDRGYLVYPGYDSDDFFYSDEDNLPRKRTKVETNADGKGCSSECKTEATVKLEINSESSAAVLTTEQNCNEYKYKIYRCHYRGCSATFSSTDDRQSHVTNAHNFGLTPNQDKNQREICPFCSTDLLNFKGGPHEKSNIFVCV